MRQITYRDALREALREEMRRDETVFLMGTDIEDPFGGSLKVTQGLSTEFGRKRVRNTPLSESGFTGLAVGAALAGLRPVVEILFIDFTAVCMDPIVNEAAKLRYMTGGQATVPLVVRTQGGAGQSAAEQHSQSLEAWFAHVPGLKVVTPATPYDAKGLLKSAIRDNNPVVFIEHKMLYGTRGPVPENEYTIPFGTTDVKRDGTDVTIIAISRMVLLALRAAERLAKEGISVEVVDPRTLSPLDEETILASVRKTRRAVVVNEAPERAGYGAYVAALCMRNAFRDLLAPVETVNSQHVPIPFAPNLEAAVVPDVDHVVAAVRRVLES